MVTKKNLKGWRCASYDSGRIDLRTMHSRCGRLSSLARWEMRKIQPTTIVIRIWNIFNFRILWAIKAIKLDEGSYMKEKGTLPFYLGRWVCGSYIYQDMCVEVRVKPQVLFIIRLSAWLFSEIRSHTGPSRCLNKRDWPPRLRCSYNLCLPSSEITVWWICIFICELGSNLGSQVCIASTLLTKLSP